MKLPDMLENILKPQKPEPEQFTGVYGPAEWFSPDPNAKNDSPLNEPIRQEPDTPEDDATKADGADSVDDEN